MKANKKYRYQILIFAEVMLLLVMIPGCLREEEQVYFLSGEDAVWQEQ